MAEFDLPGTVRRVRRTADLSQRELAAACGVAQAVVARAETGARDLPVGLLARMAALAGWRLVVVDEQAIAVPPAGGDRVRDAAGRSFPAHLDSRHGDEDWWGGPHRPRLRQPRYTYDRDRQRRDARRGDSGVPDDHHEPEPGDSLADRAAERRRAGARRAAEERQRRFLAGEFRTRDAFECSCLPECEYAEVTNEDLAHADSCDCRCDVG